MRRTRRWCNNRIRCSGSPEKSTPEATRHSIGIARDKNEDANHLDGLGHRTENPRGFAVSQPLVALGAAMFLPTVGNLTERHPGLKLIVDHMGVSRASEGEAAYRFQPELLAVARHPNVAVKATGQTGYADDEYPFRSLHPHLKRCFDASVPSACSGAPTSPACRAPGGNA